MMFMVVMSWKITNFSELKHLLLKALRHTHIMAWALSRKFPMKMTA